MWFEEALKGHEKYYDYFVWEDGVVDENGKLNPPNNWVSLIRVEVLFPVIILTSQVFHNCWTSNFFFHRLVYSAKVPGNTEKKSANITSTNL